MRRVFRTTLLGLRPAVLASSGRDRAPLALSVRQGPLVDHLAAWWTERARPEAEERGSKDAPHLSSSRESFSLERQRVPERLSAARAFEALTSSQRSLVRSFYTHSCLSDSRRATRVCYLFCDALEGRGAARRSPGAVDGVDLRPPTGLTANGYERAVSRPSARCRRARPRADVSEVLSMSDADLYVRGRQSDVWLGTESTNSRPKCGNSKRRSTG